MSFDGCKRWIPFRSLRVCGFLPRMPHDLIFHCAECYMPLVRPTLAIDIKKLEIEFSHGYCPGAHVFYVSICNEKGEEQSVIDEDKKKLGPSLDLS